MSSEAMLETRLFHGRRSSAWMGSMYGSHPGMDEVLHSGKAISPLIRHKGSSMYIGSLIQRVKNEQ